MAAAKEVDFENLFNAMTLISLEIGSQFYAKPTHIVDPHDFFLIPFPFMYHLPALNKPGKPFDVEELEENMVVVYTSTKPDLNKYFKIELDQNVRGTIQRVSEDKKCQILALDHGFIEENVTLDRIFHPIHQEALDTPSLIQHCELDLCSPKGPNFSKDAIDAFKFYIGNEKLSIVIRGKNADKLKVVVYNSNPDDIATLLALTHYTYLSINIREDLNAMTANLSREPKFKFEHMKVDIGETYTVRVQSGSSLNSFYVTPMSAYKNYLQNRADFTDYCKTLSDIKCKEFVVGTTVGVQCDISMFYERAVILAVVKKSKAKVKLVDWGTEMEVSKSKLKAIRTEFFTISPAFALYCSAVHGFEPWDNGLPQFLYKGYSFSITVKHVGKGFQTPHIVSLSRT